MRRIGDEEAGYSVEVESHAVRVTAWGFWGADVASSFAREVGEACRLVPRGSALHLDMSGLKPMREEGQLAFRDVLGMLPVLRFTSATIATASPLTRLQLLRITGSSTAKDLVRFIEGRSAA